VDVDDAIILVIAIWVVISSLVAKSIDIYITLILIGLLVASEIGWLFIKPEIRQTLRLQTYFLLFVFVIIVARKIMNILM